MFRESHKAREESNARALLYALKKTGQIGAFLATFVAGGIAGALLENSRHDSTHDTSKIEIPKK